MASYRYTLVESTGITSCELTLSAKQVSPEIRTLLAGHGRHIPTMIAVHGQDGCRAEYRVLPEPESDEPF